jgi:hypothetical protein
LKKIKKKNFDINNKLKKLKISPCKFELKKLNKDDHVVVPNLPFNLKTSESNFCKIFKFESCMKPGIMLLSATDYISENISEIVKLSVIEWHCNLIEYSYANHDDHPHLHKHELLHISFIDNNFYENPVYKEIFKKPMFIPLRKGLREIREIILTPLDESNNEKKKLKYVACLQLKEE